MHVAGVLGGARSVWKNTADRDWRFVNRWLNEGYQLSADARRQRQITLLGRLLARYSALGLDDLWPREAHPQRWEDLPKLRITERLGMREIFFRLKERYNDPSLREDMTSGTSGIRVLTLQSSSLLRRNEAHKIALQRLIGARPSTPQICLWATNQALGLPAMPRGPFSSYFYPRLQFNGFTPDAEVYRQVYEASMGLRGAMLLGYASALAECADEMWRRGWVVPQGHIRTGWASAEPLTDYRRQAIRRAFNFEPREMYGARETHWLAIECEHGTLHASARHIIEVVDEQSGHLLPDGQAGRIVITDLFNETSPIIRYALGDLGILAEEHCACGRRSQVIKELQGRISEYIRLPGGRLLHPIALTWLMRQAGLVVQWQVFREAEQSFELRYIGEPIDGGMTAAIVAKGRELLGGAEFRLSNVREIPRNASGKQVNYASGWAGDQRPLPAEP